MSVTLPLAEMSTVEKLELMESIWKDLTRESDLLDSPEWHAEVLADRERRVGAGEAGFIPWEKAKDEILNWK